MRAISTRFSTAFLRLIAISGIAAGPLTAAIEIRPCGAVPDAGWALGRLNDGTSLTRESFAYPETTTPVRLYLIDTGVAHIGTWFSQNPNLKSFRTELVTASGGPASTTALRHGSQMLSLIAGPGTGAAVGTPVHVVNYNIYPGGEGTTSTAGLLADAIDRAIGDHDQHPGMRSVICIANGSSLPGAQSGILAGVIEEAVASGIPVIVSAGNEGADASQYIPAAYGTQLGVICVGASDPNNQRLPTSNVGPAVDLYAPGFQVRTMHVDAPAPGSYQHANGTSPATALTAAAALIQLSLNPQMTPAEVEAALTTTATPAVAASPSTHVTASMDLLVQVQPDPEGDADLDGFKNLIERFFGSDPANPSDRPEPMAIRRVGNEARLSFHIASGLFNPAAPYLLADGSTWRVMISANLREWHPAAGALHVGDATADRTALTFTVPEAGNACFLRLEVTPAGEVDP